MVETKIFPMSAMASRSTSARLLEADAQAAQFGRTRKDHRSEIASADLGRAGAEHFHPEGIRLGIGAVGSREDLHVAPGDRCSEGTRALRDRSDRPVGVAGESAFWIGLVAHAVKRREEDIGGNEDRRAKQGARVRNPGGDAHDLVVVAEDVDVAVDQPRQHELVAQVDDLGAGLGFDEPVAHGLDLAAPDDDRGGAAGRLARLVEQRAGVDDGGRLGLGGGLAARAHTQNNGGAKNFSGGGRRDSTHGYSPL